MERKVKVSFQKIDLNEDGAWNHYDTTFTLELENQDYGLLDYVTSCLNIFGSFYNDNINYASPFVNWRKKILLIKKELA